MLSVTLMASLPDSVVSLDTITPKPLSWLWRPRLPAGRLSLVIGHPDRGKSVFAVTVAAHVSCGRAWPDGTLCPQGKVIFLEAEDSLDETVVPRLMAAGANLKEIVAWQDRNLSHLIDGKLLHQLHPRLLVLSPLNTYLPKLNTWNDQEVRRVLQPLSDLAAKTHTAILGIMHPPKMKQSVSIHAVAGSVAFGAVARTVLAVERGENGLCLVEGVKNNLSKPIPPLGYRIHSWAENADIPQLEWQIVSPDLSFAPPEDDQSALIEACEFVTMVLSNGPVPTTDLKIAADKNGIGWRTIARARKVLQIQACQVHSRDKSYWMLQLPPKTQSAKPPQSAIP